MLGILIEQGVVHLTLKNTKLSLYLQGKGVLRMTNMSWYAKLDDNIVDMDI